MSAGRAARCALLIVVVWLVGVAEAGAVTRYVAPGASGSACTQAAPCGSLNQAYQAAQPGDVVSVAAGSYGTQVVQKDPDKPLGSPAVGFQMTGARFSDIRSSANDVHYIGPTASTIIEFRAGRNVVLSGAKAQRPYIIGPTSSSASGDTIDNITIRGGDFGPLVSCGSGFQINTLGGRPASNIKIVGNRFHDYTIASSCPDAHLDCLHTFRGVNGLVIAGNAFTRCHDFGVLINGASNVLVENNFMNGGIFGFKLRGDTNPSVETFTNVTIRNNSADYISLGENGSNTLHNVVVEGNATVDGATCRSGVSYRNNLAERGTRCSGNDFANAPVGFANPGAGDFHITRSSPAVDRITTGPASDIDGNPRPQGAKNDIGAHEVRQAGSPPPPPPPPDPGDDDDGGSGGPGLPDLPSLPDLPDPRDVDLPGVDGLSLPTPDGAEPRTVLRPTQRRLRVSRRGIVRLRLSCVPAASVATGHSCAGTVALDQARKPGSARRAGRMLGRAAFGIASGRTEVVSVRLSRTARALARRTATLRTRVRVRTRRDDSRTSTTSRRVTLVTTSA